jgi:hypothetical protein
MIELVNHAKSQRIMYLLIMVMVFSFWLLLLHQLNTLPTYLIMKRKPVTWNLSTEYTGFQRYIRCSSFFHIIALP